MIRKRNDSEKKEKAPVFEERSVKADRMKLWRDDFRRLCISVDGKEFEDQTPRKVFPLSEKGKFISFLNKDNNETVMLIDPDNLDKESRKTLDESLKTMYYAAVITRVDSITEKMGVGSWKVMTDRGYAMFEVPDRQTIRRLSGGRYIISDADGNRFEIPDVMELDERSRTIVSSEI